MLKNPQGSPEQFRSWMARTGLNQPVGGLPVLTTS
jgi:hypothetical protein